ncbi:MAG: HDOD domain-containing protein [bacterium]
MTPSAFDHFRKPPSGRPAPLPATSASSGGAPVATSSGLFSQVPLVVKERRAKAILASLDNLPTLPAVAMEVIHLSRNANATASDFEEILRRDQALTARVLRLVNSPFFGLRSRVTSIPQAIVVLGLRTLRSVVLAAQTSHLLDRQLGPYGLAEGGMWKHSMACATLTGTVARGLHLPPDVREEVFVGGLLHDVGKIILAPHIASAQQEFDGVIGRTRDVVRAETETFGMSHPEVGGKMGRKWGLSATLVELIEEHHHPLEPGRTKPGVLVVQVANELCHQLGVGRKDGPRAPGADFAPRVAALGIAGPIDALLDSARETVAGLEHVFQELART